MNNIIFNFFFSKKFKRKYISIYGYLSLFKNFNRHILGKPNYKLEPKLSKHYNLEYARGCSVAFIIFLLTFNFYPKKKDDHYQFLTKDQILDYDKFTSDDISTIDKSINKNEKITLKFPKEKPDEFGDRQMLGFGNNIDARTLISLFEEEDYNLQDVRKGKAVDPIFLSKLPSGIKKIDNIRDRKKLFIRVVLPLIILENDKILADREFLNQLSREKSINNEEQIWLTKKFKEYKVTNKKIEKLFLKMDVIPVSIALAQAAYESGWGTSRFAMEGNSLYGARTWKKGKGIVPNERDEGQKFEVAAYKIIRASISAYKKNLNTHQSYQEFRNARAKQRAEKNKINGLKLAKFLYNYSEIGFTYAERLAKIIKQNSLTDFDNAILSKKKKPNIV